MRNWLRNLRLHPCLLFAVGILYLWVALLNLGCSGAGKIGGTVKPPDNAALTPNYLDSVLPAYWEGPVHYQILGGDSPIPFVDMPRVTRRGVGRWDYTLRELRTIEQAADAPITIEYVPKDLLGGGNTIGLTELVTDGGSKIIAARIKILRSLDPIKMEAVAAHEMGHALGCRGHSPHAGDLMYKTVPLRAFVQLRDHNTIRSFYFPSTTTRAAPQGVPGPTTTVTVCRLTSDDLVAEADIEGDHSEQSF